MGSKILFFLTKIPDIIANHSVQYLIQTALHSGFVFYGGLFGTLLAIKIFQNKYPDHDIWQFVTPAIPLFHAFGRIGCLLAGCCYGKEATWGIIRLGEKVPRLPVQLFESIFNIVVFCILLFLEKKQKRTKTIYVYLTLYPIFRFINEFFRGDTVRGIWGILSTSQIISLIVLAFVFLHLIKEFVLNSKSKTI